jgi:hypothetical protein
MIEAIRGHLQRIRAATSFLGLLFAGALGPVALNRSRSEPKSFRKTYIFIYFYLLLSIFTVQIIAARLRRSTLEFSMFLNVSQCFPMFCSLSLPPAFL